jgi:hypothetical protein
MVSSKRQPWALSLRRTPDLKTDDHRMAADFLSGVGMGTRKHPGLLQDQYLKPGTRNELIARDALLRVLRNDAPPPPTIRKMLADLFDPDSKLCGRRLVFRRRKGALPSAARQIGRAIERTGSSVLRKSVAFDLMERYDLSHKQVFNYWKMYRDFKKV